MKYLKHTFLLILASITCHTSSAQTSSETESETESGAVILGIVDEENRFRRWNATIAGGQYSVALSSITSLSKTSYVLDGGLLVTEVTIDTTGSAFARFYYIEPITKDTNFDTLTRAQNRLEELRKQTRKRTGIKVDEMVQKSYPSTTHARTIEFRILDEAQLNALYTSVNQAWTSNKGRNFSIQ